MIPKYLRGANFDSLIRYLVHAPGRGGLPRPGATVLGIQGVLGIQTAAIEMAAVARRSERVRKPVVHLSLSLPPPERLDDARWIAVIERAERELGLLGHQRVIVRHDDADHSHVHIGWNAIHPETSRTPSAKWDSNAKKRLSDLCRTVERELGLRPLEQSRVSLLQLKKAPLAPIPEAPELVYVSQGQQARESRMGELPLADTHGTRIKAALRRSTWDERAAELAVLGLQMRLYLDPRNPRRRGLVIEDLADIGKRCTGSDLGSDYGLGAIERRSEETLEQWLSRQSGTPPLASASVSDALHASSDPNHARLWDEYQQYREDCHSRRENLRRKRKQQAHAHQLQRTAERISQRTRRRHVWRAKDGPAMRWLIRQIAEWRERVERRALLARHRHERKAIIQEARVIAAPTWDDYLARRAAAGDDGAARILARTKSRKRRPADRSNEITRSTGPAATPSVDHTQTQAGALPTDQSVEVSSSAPRRSVTPSDERRQTVEPQDHSPVTLPRSRGGVEM